MVARELRQVEPVLARLARQLLRAVIVATVVVGVLVQVPPAPVSWAQSDRCQAVAGEAQPLTGDHASGTVQGPGMPAVWRIDGVVGRTVVHLGGLTADLDLYVCAPDGRLVAHDVAEGLAD